jgi:hypothetical protein
MGFWSLLARIHHRRPAALAWLPAVFIAGCAQAPPASTGTPPLPHSDAAPGPLYSLFHRPLANPEGKVAILQLHGQGAQIFRCEAQPDGRHWTYRLPEAELSDADGMVAVRHGVNLSFEHVDGSRLLGEIADHVASPVDNALPWLLLNTRSYGKGTLTGITQVQRINTVGGMPPTNCDSAQLGQVLRVPFTADFVFYR